MKTIIKTLAAISFISMMSQTSLAADAANGKTLHNESCLSCHSSLMNGKPDTIYTRSDRRVNSLSALQKQVTRCQNSVGANWFDDQIEDVVNYLNTTFYKTK